uniref:Uncharacterized protein n=1 Tax=Vitis vinifera TaxID=29760 RepID=A5C5H0_VITVI|nr:hypothetical protein VITISV_003154 [Vitis vinifera]
MVFSGLRVLTKFWLGPQLVSSRTDAFGWIRCQQKYLFLLGKLRGGRSSPWISFKEGGGSSLTGVFCVDVKRKVRIILCYIVQWLRLYGRSLSPFLESNGCSQNQL